VLAFFKSQQPISVLAFFLFFVVLKIPFFFIPTPAIAEVQSIWQFEPIVSLNSTLSIVLAQVCLLLQALWLNRMFHQADFHEGNSLIPAIYFALLSSLIPTFNVFSIYTLINFILLAIFQVFLSITSKDNTRVECFNVGFFAGLLVLFDVNFSLFIPFVFIILYAIKSFRLNDYIILFFGIFFPIYLALGISYIAFISINADVWLVENFNLIKINYDIFNLVSLSMTVIYILFSFVSMRGILYSVAFKRRKNLNMLIFLFIGIAVTTLLSGKLDETAFSLLLIPVCIFLTLFMLRIRKKRLGEILNAIFVIVIFVTNLIRLFK